MRTGILLVLLLSVFLLVSVSSVHARTVTDMAGRHVEIPENVSRVITLGSIPVINSFIFAMGEGKSIISGLSFAQTDRWKYQRIFAPHLSNAPEVQGKSREPLVEEILALKPDVVFTMDKPTVDQLEKLNLPVVFLRWTNDDDIKQLFNLLGNVYSKPERAAAYLSWFDKTLNNVRGIIASIPEAQRPSVLFAQLNAMAQPHLIAEWWIKESGGRSVTNAARNSESQPFSYEDLLVWNPDVLLVIAQADKATALADDNLKKMKAIEKSRVYVTPVGAHIWANRSAELPLMLLWTATTLHPQMANKFDIHGEMLKFYKEFYGYSMSLEEAKSITGLGQK